MKKVLLLCLTALMCCVTGAWAQTSGSGTKDDPYVYTVEDGSVVSIPASTFAILEFNAPSSGTVTLTPNAFANYYWNIQNASGEWVTVGRKGPDYANNAAFSYQVEAGLNRFMNNVGAYVDAEVTVTFEGAAADALDVVSSDPAEGSAVDGFTADSPLTVTFNKPIGYLEASIMGGNGTTEVYTQFASETTDEGTTWVLTPGGIDVALYQGVTYTVTLNAYNSYDDWYAGQIEPETTTITFTGTKGAAVLSDIHIVSITPDPSNEDDMENMISSSNPTLTVEFSGNVDVKACTVGEGQGMGEVPVDFKVNGSTLTVDLSSAISSNSYTLMLNINVYDTEGNPLSGEGDDYDFMLASSTYVIDIPVADGRGADMSLGYYMLTPEGTYVQSVAGDDTMYLESLSSVGFTVIGGGDTDGYYFLTSKANAGLYDAEGNKVADVLLTRSDENVSSITATVCELGTVDNAAGTGTPLSVATPGTYTLRIDEMSIGDGNFDENYPWLSGFSGVGRCNPAWEFALVVVDELVSVTNITPAPYSVSGEYNEEFPAEMTVEFSSENVKVSSVLFTYGMGNRAQADYSLSGKTLTIDVPEVLREEHTLNLTVIATSTSGQPILYGDYENAGINVIAVTFEKPAGELAMTITPASGTTVESLSTITIEIDDQLQLNIENWNPYDVLNANGEVVTTAAVDYHENWNILNIAVLTLAETITEPGTYTIEIPAGAFTDGDYTMANTAVTLTYTIETSTGIDSIGVSADDNVKVYSIDGVRVGEGKASAVLGTLPKGVYIVNGTKIAVK